MKAGGSPAGRPDSLETSLQPLACFAVFSFVLDGALYFLGIHILAGLTGFQWFKFMGVALALAIVGAVLRSKHWKIALPVSAVMFFFTMYVMGT
jgi:hypothetical protein